MSATVNPPEHYDYERTEGGEQRTEEDRPHRPTHRRYNARVVARAREHRAAGWSHAAISSLLAQEFGCVPPSRTTVFYWTDDAARARKLASDAARQRAMSAASPKLKVWARSVEYQTAFVRRLRAAGEPVSGIVRVCRIVFGGKWTRGRVERLLEVES